MNISVAYNIKDLVTLAACNIAEDNPHIDWENVSIDWQFNENNRKFSKSELILNIDYEELKEIEENDEFPIS